MTAAHSGCLSLRLLRDVTVKILKVQRMWTTRLNKSYSRLFVPHRVPIVVFIQLELDFKGAFKWENLIQIAELS